MKNLENKNPGDNDGWNSLHCTAFHVQLNACELIMKNLENKNPGNHHGYKLLHFAAEKGFFRFVNFL